MEDHYKCCCCSYRHGESTRAERIKEDRGAEEVPEGVHSYTCMMMAANRPPVALLSQFLRSNKFGIRHFSSSSKGSSKSPLGRSSWFGIPITLGVACIGLVHLRRQLLKDKDNPASVHPMTWQVTYRTCKYVWDRVV